MMFQADFCHPETKGQDMSNSCCDFNQNLPIVAMVEIW